MGFLTAPVLSLVEGFGMTKDVASLALVTATVVSFAADAPQARVAFDTSFGRIVVALDAERAPVSVANFLRYLEDGHFDGTIFHKVVDGFVIQGGGFDAAMTERPTRAAIVNEAKNGLSNRIGTIAMAREAAIDSATAQFYINVTDNVALDHVEVPSQGITLVRRDSEVRIGPDEAHRVFGYAVFGRVVEGMDVVERIRHVTTRTVGEFENVPVDPVVINKAALLPS